MIFLYIPAKNINIITERHIENTRFLLCYLKYKYFYLSFVLEQMLKQIICKRTSQLDGTQNNRRCTHHRSDRGHMQLRIQSFNHQRAVMID